VFRIASPSAIDEAIRRHYGEADSVPAAGIE
jgi:hypothetical protein